MTALPSLRVRRALVSGALRALAVNAAAVMSLLLFLAGRWPVLAFLLAGAVLARAMWLGRRRSSGPFVGARVLVVAGIVVAYTARVGELPVTLLVAALLLELMTLHETTVRKLAGFRGAQAAHLPGYSAPRASLLNGSRIFWLNCGATVALAVGAITGAPPVWALVLVALLVAGTCLVVGYDAARPPAARHPVSASVRTCLEGLTPKYLVYFSAPRGSEYQVAMWLPYFDRIGVPYAILLRERAALPRVAKLTTAPVVVATTLAALDDSMVPSLNAVFYVNNGMKNTHAVRFMHLTHVQLLHGDSDKPPSYSPVTAMYDKVFVAGQAGIDRYAQHGVHIPAEKFVIVGRPQVEAIAVTNRPVAEAVPPTVLYAPTWKGHYADTDFCSLPVAPDLMTRLVARGATVILRPHPFSRKHAESAAQLAQAEEILAADAATTGRKHLYGEAASADVTLFECFDRSDAMICDVSSVASDYLFSGKPFAVMDMTTTGGGDFAEVFPLARAAYVLHPGGQDTDRMLHLLLGEDPLAAARSEARRYYLGDFPAEGYAEGFLAAARAVVSDEGHSVARGISGPGAEAGEQAEEEAEWLAEVDDGV